MLERYGHGAAVLSVSSECVEVILFGGRNEFLGSELVETVVLRFGRSYKGYSLNNLIYSQHFHHLCGVHICLIPILHRACALQVIV